MDALPNGLGEILMQFNDLRHQLTAALAAPPL